MIELLKRSRKNFKRLPIRFEYILQASFSSQTLWNQPKLFGQLSILILTPNEKIWPVLLQISLNWCRYKITKKIYTYRYEVGADYICNFIYSGCSRNTTQLPDEDIIATNVGGISVALFTI